MNIPEPLLMGERCSFPSGLCSLLFRRWLALTFFCALSAPLVTVANPPGQEPSGDWRYQKYRGFFSLRTHLINV